jgi:hypothetical protein
VFSCLKYDDAADVRCCGFEDNVLQVQVMKKEVFIIHAESRQAKEFMLREFEECAAAAAGRTSFSPSSWALADREYSDFGSGTSQTRKQYLRAQQS